MPFRGGREGRRIDGRRQNWRLGAFLQKRAARSTRTPIPAGDVCSPALGRAAYELRAGAGATFKGRFHIGRAAVSAPYSPAVGRAGGRGGWGASEKNPPSIDRGGLPPLIDAPGFGPENLGVRHS